MDNASLLRATLTDPFHIYRRGQHLELRATGPSLLQASVAWASLDHSKFPALGCPSLSNGRRTESLSWSLNKISVSKSHQRSRRVLTASSQNDNEGGGDVKQDKLKEFLDPIEAFLGRRFGSPLWYAVLLLGIAIFGGGYAYLIFNFADFADIPILNGPQGIR